MTCILVSERPCTWLLPQKFLVRSSYAYPIGMKNFYTWFLSSKNPSIGPAFPLISGVEWRGAGQVRLSFAPPW